MESQWLFPLSALERTPTQANLAKELYDRARGVEFLYRLGSSLQLHTAAMFTAATWFHRFYMRFSMEDFHRQEVAASCIFLATKTEECGRKLRDVARVYLAKVTNQDIMTIPTEGPEVEQCQATILLVEEALLEAICFDLVVESPHAELVDLFQARDTDEMVQEYAWSIAHDSYRTPLCLLQSTRIIAAACYVLAQCVADGPDSLSLDARISLVPPSASLPTPPTHQPTSPNASRLAVEYYQFSAEETVALSETLGLLVEFYSVQDFDAHPHLAKLRLIQPPSRASERPSMYLSFALIHAQATGAQPLAGPLQGTGTPLSTHGGDTPKKNSPGKSQPGGKEMLRRPLDLS